MKITIASAVILLVAAGAGAADKKIDFDWASGSFSTGRVLAVSETGITIARSEGKTNEVLTYPFHDRLAEGSYNRGASDAFAYRAKDLEAGDLVVLQILKLESKTDFCVSMSLRSRPDGPIPASQKPDAKAPYHARRNAYAEFAKNGTPVPPHLSAGSREPPRK